MKIRQFTRKEINIDAISRQVILSKETQRRTNIGVYIRLHLGFLVVKTKKQISNKMRRGLHGMWMIKMTGVNNHQLFYHLDLERTIMAEVMSQTVI